MMPEADISQLELQDYIDGRLSSERTSVVEAYLASHPESAAQVAALKAQAEVLKRLGEDVLEEPIPDKLAMLLRKIT